MHKDKFKKQSCPLSIFQLRISQAPAINPSHTSWERYCLVGWSHRTELNNRNECKKGSFFFFIIEVFLGSAMTLITLNIKSNIHFERESISMELEVNRQFDNQIQKQILPFRQSQLLWMKIVRQNIDIYKISTKFTKEQSVLYFILSLSSWL